MSFYEKVNSFIFCTHASEKTSYFLLVDLIMRGNSFIISRWLAILHYLSDQNDVTSDLKLPPKICETSFLEQIWGF